MISRRMFIQGACGTVLGVMSVGSYSYFLEPRWIELKNIIIKIHALPKQFEGMTIAQLSDIHHSKYVPREFVRRCVRKVNALSPDIIALTGDYIYGAQDSCIPVAAHIARQSPVHSVCCVLNNHDCRDI